MDLDKLFAEFEVSQTQSHSVLIVDDNHAMTDYLSEFCHDLKITCHAFNNALDALKNFAVIKPSLLIVDWLMQPMDGLTFINQVRKKYDPHVPILFMTGSAQATTQIQALKNATCFVEKNNDNNDLLELQIKALLNLKPINNQSLPEKIIINSLKFSASEWHLFNSWHEAINKYIKTDYSLTDIVNSMQQSPNKIKSFISRHFSVTPQEYVISYRLYKAKKLLFLGEPIQHVAEQLGYSNSGNFSNAFKAKYSLPPLQYVKSKRLAAAS
ncbi:MAG: response regulator transcription factor [Colwellia sp.]|nr:response regulator transcription factor [Colwellia sp.]MCW8863933.1 response regulator transcription factor [Colwellia sp.]MCW9082195.1 response regulator transcription factor [Colwellia sp.]